MYSGEARGSQGRPPIIQLDRKYAFWGGPGEPGPSSDNTITSAFLTAGKIPTNEFPQEMFKKVRLTVKSEVIMKNCGQPQKTVVKQKIAVNQNNEKCTLSRDIMPAHD